MRQLDIIFRTFAALLIALFVTTAPAQGQTITNTARANWSEGGVTRSAISNTVDITVATFPATLTTYRPNPRGGSTLPVRQTFCQSTVQRASAAANGAAASSSTTSITAEQTNSLTIGEDLVIEFASQAANSDPDAIDSVSVVLTTPRGDRETIVIYETDNDTGYFHRHHCNTCNSARTRAERLPAQPCVG